MLPMPLIPPILPIPVPEIIPPIDEPVPEPEPIVVVVVVVDPVDPVDPDVTLDISLKILFTASSALFFSVLAASNLD